MGSGCVFWSIHFTAFTPGDADGIRSVEFTGQRHLDRTVLMNSHMNTTVTNNSQTEKSTPMNTDTSTDVSIGRRVWHTPTLVLLQRGAAAASGGTRSTDGCSTQYAGTS